MDFQDLKLNKQLLSAIEELGYTVPTDIQQKAIPPILAGNDVLGIAQTGTGKTAAYLLPLLMRTKFAQGENPRVLILAPTRELIMQISKNFEELAKYTDLRQVCLYGGIGPKIQIAALEKGVDILITTPGRFMELYRENHIYPRDIKCLVLDEADKMMDMGFMPQIRKIQEIIPQKRQNLLFSATFSARVEHLSEEFLDFPIKIEITPQATTKSSVKQVKYATPNVQTKIGLLLHLLADKELFNRVIVFTKTKDTAESLSRFLERKFPNDPIKVIHGNKGQNTRINAMETFKEGDIRILVATDVVARGIDVTMVSHVINFDIPLLYEDYVHRIGRTGRADNEGNAISFYNLAEEYHVKKIEKLINMEIEEVFLPASVEIFETPFEEKQEMLRELDYLKKKEDPDYKGAFHEKRNARKTTKSGTTGSQASSNKTNSSGKMFLAGNKPIGKTFSKSGNKKSKKFDIKKKYGK